MFHSGLSWAEALALLVDGAFVRRERWTDKRLFRTEGALVWVDAVPPRVVQSADFGRAEFLARDWTDAGFDQGGCIPHPNSTRILVDETALVKVQPYVPGYKSLNPPSWGAYIEGPNGVRHYNYLRAGDWSGGLPPGTYWVNDFAGKSEPVTYTDIPAIPESGYGPTAMLARTIPNPFAAACSVAISGTATDALLLDAREVALPVAFHLAEAASFTLAALVRNPPSQPAATLHLEVDLSL